jgi:hypothetical protein
MAIQVSIYSVTGQSPYDVYVCQSDGSNCFYMTTVSSFPYTFNIPAPYNTSSSYLLKLIDDNGCVISGVQEVTSCNTETQTPTPTITTTPTVTPTSTQTPTVTPTVTNTPTVTTTTTSTQTPGASPSQTQTVTPTNSQTPTITPTTTETPTPTVTNTPTNTETPTPTVTNTQTSTPTPTNTETPTPTVTNTQTSTPTPTNTETPTNTPTPTVTNTETPTNTPTPTVTNTQTSTPTPTNTETPTTTPTPTVTETPTTTPTPTVTETPTQTPPLNLCILSSTTITTSGSTSCPGNDDEVTTYVFQLADLSNNPVTIGSDVNLQLDGTALPCVGPSAPVSTNLTIVAGTSSVQYSFYSKQYDPSSPCNCGYDLLSFNTFAIVAPFPPYTNINFCGLMTPTPTPTPTVTPTNPVSVFPLSYTGTNQTDACNNLNGGIGTPATYYTIGYPGLGTTIWVDSFTSVPLVGADAVTLNGDAWGVDPLNGQINLSSIVC